MGNLPLGHIAIKEGEVVAHGKHVDLVAPTSYGSHQVRIVDLGDVHYAVDPSTDKIVGRVTWDNIQGKQVITDMDDQHNFSKNFNDEPARSFSWEDRPFDDRFNIDRNGNLHDRVGANGLPDPRGTAMGGYNRR